MTREEFDKQHEGECPIWNLLVGINRYFGNVVDDSLHAWVLSIIAIILSAISIALRFA